MNTSHNAHVKSYPDYHGMKTPFIFLDYLLGSLLLLCTLVGIPGNVSGIFFFVTKTRRDRVTLLYIVICSVDSVTTLVNLPVAIAMFRGRQPGVFNNYLFCVLWEVLYTILQKLSIFLVLLLSLSRTITILKPFHKIRIVTILCSVVGYVVFLLLIPVLQYVITPLRGKFKYSWDGAYCYYNFQMKFEHVVNLILVGLPPIITFIVLIVFLVRLSNIRRLLRTSRRTRTKDMKSWKQQASITITMFTSLFLVCNLPLFINLMHNMTTRFFGVKYPGVYFGTRFMFWYSWHIAKMQSVVVNAALNPVLYYCRMRSFRTWCNQIFSCKSVRVKDLVDQTSLVIFKYKATKKCTNIVKIPTHLRIDSRMKENDIIIESPWSHTDVIMVDTVKLPNQGLKPGGELLGLVKVTHQTVL